MYRNWNYPNPYNQSQPQWQNQGRNNHINYSQNPHFQRQITIQEAINIALAQVPGQAVKAELDTKQGVRIFEVDVVTAQGLKYEIAVDINTGEIIEIDLD